MAPLVIWLTPASLLSKQKDYRTIEIKQRAKYDGEPGNSKGLSLMGLLNPFWWIMHELAWSCQPSWSASSYGSSDPNKEGTAVASWLLPQQASCLTSVFEKPYWSWAGIPWNGLLLATSSFVNPSWQSPNTGNKAFLWLRDPRNGLLYNTRDKLSLFWASDKSLSDLGGTIRVCPQETFWAQTHCFMVLTPKHNSPLKGD